MSSHFPGSQASVCTEPNLSDKCPHSSFPFYCHVVGDIPVASVGQLCHLPGSWRGRCCRGSPGAVPVPLSTPGLAAAPPGHQHSPARGAGGKPAAAPAEPGRSLSVSSQRGAEHSRQDVALCPPLMSEFPSLQVACCSMTPRKGLPICTIGAPTAAQCWASWTCSSPSRKSRRRRTLCSKFTRESLLERSFFASLLFQQLIESNEYYPQMFQVCEIPQMLLNVAQIYVTCKAALLLMWII